MRHSVVLILSLIVGLSVASGDLTPAQLNAAAIEKAQEGDLRVALQMFSRAVQAEPDSAEYVNNMGVTQMRAGMLKEALSSFDRALAIQPSNEDAADNRRELRDYLRKVGKLPSDSEKEDQRAEERRKERAAGETSGRHGDGVVTGYVPNPGPPASSISVDNDPANYQHTVRKLPVVHWNDLYKQENLQYRTGQTPFKLVGIPTSSDDWRRLSPGGADADKGWSSWDVDFFKSRFGNRKVDYYPHNMEASNVRPYYTQFAQALSDLVNPKMQPRSLKRPSSGYIQWNIDMDDWHVMKQGVGRLPAQFASDDDWLAGCLRTEDLKDEYHISTHWRMVLVGSAGAGMFNHWDTLHTSSFQFQTKGRKRWHLCSPQQDHLFYGAAGVDTFNPDYEGRPLFRQTDCFLDVVEEGEAVFYTADFWHQTENLDTPTISISSTLIDTENALAVSQELKKECRRESSRIIHPSDALCTALEGCFAWWENAFRGVVAAENSTLGQGDFFYETPESKSALKNLPESVMTEDFSTVRIGGLDATCRRQSRGELGEALATELRHGVGRYNA